MSTRDITLLRHEGRLDEALALAKQEMENAPTDKWCKSAMFWVLRDIVKNKCIPSSNHMEANKHLNHMKALLLDMEDEDGLAKRAYQTLSMLLIPHATHIAALSELAKTNPNLAYQKLLEISDPSGKDIDSQLHENFGWIIYRYMKANVSTFSSIETRKLLHNYIQLNNPRPSMLHSVILGFALNHSRKYSDFNFYRFFVLWNPHNLRPEDFDNGHVNGQEINALVTRICQRIVETEENISIPNFLELFDPVLRQSQEHTIIEALREAYFWKIWNLNKDQKYHQLWPIFDYYADSFPIFGASHWHSEILRMAYQCMNENGNRQFLDFFKRWYGDGNFQKNDWNQQQGKDGKYYPALANNCIKKAFEELKGYPDLPSMHNTLLWLSDLYQTAIDIDRKNDWNIRDHAMICLWLGNQDQAISQYLELLQKMPEKYYLWAELADCITQDQSLHTGLLLKAKHAEKNEDFLGDIHLALAQDWLKAGYPVLASKELDVYAKHRDQKGWRKSGIFHQLTSQLNTSNTPPNHMEYKKALPTREDEKDIYYQYLQIAEDFVYSNYEQKDFILTKRWKNETTEWCSFFDGKSYIFSTKTKRFPLLKKAQTGDIFRFRYMEENTENNKNTLIPSTNQPHYLDIRPLTIQISALEKWSILPFQYGFIEYINEVKQVLHIVNQDSKIVFAKHCANHIKQHTFVKFREYPEKRKDGISLAATDIHPCRKEEALEHMPSGYFMVDNVNNIKRLFHVVSKTTGLDDVITYSNTNIRPSLGDRLLISYYIKRDKQGRKRIFVLNVSEAEGE